MPARRTRIPEGCRPPQRIRYGSLHWLQPPDAEPVIARWDKGAWFVLVGSAERGVRMTPWVATANGWRYLAPRLPGQIEPPGEKMAAD